MPRGSVSREKRTARRASTGVNEARRTTSRVDLEKDTVTPRRQRLAATGSTSLPLSDRDVAWDAGAARKGLDPAQYPKAFFWRDPEGDPKTLAAYKLPFAVNDGGLKAIWKGVTACAGVVQGARGGADIPEADVAGVRGKIAAYYRKAAKQYDDPSIKVPWDAGAANAAAVVLANLGVETDADDEAVLLAYAESGPDPEIFRERLEAWRTFALDGESDPRDATRAVLAAAGVDDPPLEPATTYELTRGSLGERIFYAEAIRAGLPVTRTASWPCEAELGDHGESLHRGDGDDEAVFRLPSGAIVHAGIGGGWFYAKVASESRTAGADAISEFAHAYPALFREETDAGLVPITFWTLGPYGPVSRMRMIEASSWEDVEANYSAGVRAELDRLMSDDFEMGKDGQLLLWQGDPGTGKTWALRALASDWRDRAEFHYITDPDAFFVHNPSYMIDVLLHETYDELVQTGDGEDAEVVSSNRDGGKWRVLILEDTGELLSARAKEEYGQGVSRLLNVVDGMVGQGLKVLAIVTTNDELGDLHPAAVRPGRCASQIVFGPLSAEEAADWLGTGEEVTEPMTLAELYAYSREVEAADAFQADGECSCGHMADQHADGTGACSVDGCLCAGFEGPSMSSSAESDAITTEPDAVLPFLIRAPAADLERVVHAAMEIQGTPVRIGDSVVGFMVPSEITREGVRFGFEPLDVSKRNAEETARRKLDNVWLEGFQTLEVPVADERPETRPSPEVAPPEAAAGSEKRWTAILCPEGVATDDGRMFAPGSITWRTLPLSLMAQIETSEGHDGSMPVGRIDRIWREGDLIMAEGVFDDSEIGNEIARMVADGVLRGISVDIAIREYDMQDPDGEDDGETDPVEIIFGDGPKIFVVTDGVIGAVTIVSFPAFAEACISVVASGAGLRYSHQGVISVTRRPEAEAEPSPEDVGPPDVLTASAAGVATEAPPSTWFDDPELEELTPLNVDESGRVYGHLACWNTCHIGIPDTCTVAPHSSVGYAYFHLGEVLCEDGESVAVGKITLGTGHADPRLGRVAATEHYDDTGTIAAFVRAGEDDHGIWVAGSLNGDLGEEKVRLLRATPLSGDWRRINGNLELVAALAVNVPGFPIPRPHGLVASGEEGPCYLSLVAAGIHQGGVPVDDAYALDPASLEKIAALTASADGAFDAEDDEG